MHTRVHKVWLEMHRTGAVFTRFPQASVDERPAVWAHNSTWEPITIVRSVGRWKTWTPELEL